MWISYPILFLGKYNIHFFASKTLTKLEQNYSIPTLECLAVVWGIRKFRHFIHGTRFTLYTDSFALQFLKSKKTTSPQLQRCRWELEKHNFVIKYKRGTTNIADPLSRMVTDKQHEQLENKEFIVANQQEFEVEDILDTKLDKNGKPLLKRDWFLEVLFRLFLRLES